MVFFFMVKVFCYVKVYFFYFPVREDTNRCAVDLFPVRVFTNQYTTRTKIMMISQTGRINFQKRRIAFPEIISLLNIKTRRWRVFMLHDRKKLNQSFKIG